MTSPAAPTSPSNDPEPNPDRPKDSGPAALYDAVGAEHAAIYGYGVVSAHIMPEQNELVSKSLAEHRDRRETAVSMLAQQSVNAPLPAAGYQMPFVVKNYVDAAKLAIRMEDDCAVAWRAVLEQSDSEQERTFALTALTKTAVTAARWRQVLGAWPVTRAFPGGNE